MKNLIDSLKKVLVAFGVAESVEDITDNNAVELVEALADGLISGNRLKPLTVTFSGTNAGGDAACDTSYADIVAAVTVGRQLILTYVDSDDNVYYLSQYKIKDNVVSGAFSYTEVDDGTVTDYVYVKCGISSTDTVSTFFTTSASA